MSNVPVPNATPPSLGPIILRGVISSIDLDYRTATLKSGSDRVTFTFDSIKFKQRLLYAMGINMIVLVSLSSVKSNGERYLDQIEQLLPIVIPESE